VTPYILSVSVGILVGAIYSLLSVRSPAPPVIALVGLLGILVGEQLPPLLRSAWRGDTVNIARRDSPRASLLEIQPADVAIRSNGIEGREADSF
jgi:XapX domain-containing protein